MATDNGNIFAIDFTSDGLTAAFVSPDGVEEGTAEIELINFQAGEGRSLDKFVGLLLAKAKASGIAFSAMSLSLPCDLDSARTKVVHFPQAPWLNDQPLPEVLSSALEVPVVMERKAVVRLCYDKIMLGLPDDGLILGCYIDMHYDTAIWYRGGPLLGKHGSAGNIAHLAIQDRADVCFCGKEGCVDLFGAGTRLQQLHMMIFPDTPKADLFERHGDHPIIRDYIGMMAYPLAMEMNVLDPEYLVIGGSIPAMRGFPGKFLEQEILRHMYRPDPDSAAVILPSAASMGSGALCAAQYARLKLGMI